LDLTLTDDQRTLLVSILQDTLGEVREEIYKSELSDFREELHQKEALLRDLLAALGAAPLAR
jgi:hypothetical protein